MASNENASRPDGAATRRATSASSDDDHSALRTDAIATLRDWVGGSLAAMQNIVAGIEQVHRLGLQGLVAWEEALAAGAAEIAKADDVYKLFGVPMGIVNRQLEQMTRQFSASATQFLEAQGRRLEPDGQRRGRVESHSSGQASAATMDAWLAQNLAQTQDAWLAIGRTWIDTLNAATPRVGSPAAGAMRP